MFAYLGAPGVTPAAVNASRRSGTPGVSSGRSSTPAAAAAGRSSTPGGGAGGGSRMSTPAGTFPAYHPPPSHGHSNLNPARGGGDESAAFLADLVDVRMPPVADATTRAFNCDVCGTALSGRPRVECLECRHLVCSECYNFEKTAPGNHRLSHRQQTLRPRDYPKMHRPHGRVPEYFCDCCHKDLTREPRARCVECKNYDQCLDCLILGETTLRHRVSHSVNVIISHIAAAPVLMGSDMQPTALLEKLIDAVFTYIDSTFSPRHTSLLEPSALSAFYSKIGVSPADNVFRSADDDALAREFSRAGCEYHLVSDCAGAIAARAKPWAPDRLDTTPRAPALTRQGWCRWFVLLCWKDPDLAHFVLCNSLATGKVYSKRKGEPYRLSFPRESLPRLQQVPAPPPPTMPRVARRRSVGAGAAGSRPASRGA